LPGGKPGKNNPAKTGLKRVALRPDGYFAPVRDGRPHYEYEAEMQKIELSATPAIDKIRAFQQINTSEKDLVARYILTMAKRRTARDQNLGPQLNQATSTVVAAARSQLKAASLRGDSKQAEKLQDLADFWESNGAVMFARESMIQEVGFARAALMKPLWEFVKAAPDHYFVTTDNPVGNGGLYTTLVFPISQDVVLKYALAGKDLTYREATPEVHAVMSSI
jgi:hypothetical protein